MRTLSKKTQYSLRALYSLARSHRAGPRLIVDLAEQESIPKKFLEQILLGLKSAGFVESKKGRHGGYSLARNPSEITLGEVIRRMEGPLAPLPCASETAYRKCDECADAETCGTRMVMREVRDATALILDGTTLADVCARIEQAQGQKADADALMYYI
ncbi:MAG: Rrf2 family transcriptional regulator [Bryobacterales bacterium]|nr:Rrf2 family transcriptional regulator [Bryobacterales bacterium]